MEKKYVSIGSCCTTPLLFEEIGIKKESLPFDWMFSTPEFVYKIIKLLIVDKIEVSDIVENDFFLCDKKAMCLHLPDRRGKDGRYFTIETGHALVNSKYNVCFPHDVNDPIFKNKYIRRLSRLKELILSEDNFIYFVYVSESSPNFGTYTLNRVKPVKDLYLYIEKINNIIKDVRDNYKIIIFDTSKPNDIEPSDSEHMGYYELKKQSSGDALKSELIYKCNRIFI
jgi:hypothetical protein